MKQSRRFIAGFTLIELIVAIGIITVLAAIVIIAVNPARQFARARNTTRYNDVRAIYSALTQHSADNKGQITAKITETGQVICNGQNGTVTCPLDAVDLSPELLPNYLPNIPRDPKTGTNEDTRYQVYIDNEGLIVVALDAELGEEITSRKRAPAIVISPTPPPPTPTPTPFAAVFQRTSSQQLSKASPAGLPGGQEGSVTIAGWVNLAATGFPTKYVISAANSSTVRRFDLAQNDSDSRIAFNVSRSASDYGHVSSAPISAGQWYFVVAWYDAAANTVNIQLNNGSVSSASYANGMMDDSVNISIGSFAGFGYFDGRIDNMGVWGRALSSGERSALYDSGTGLSYPELSNDLKDSLVSFWNFDEQSGTRVDAHGSNSLSDNNGVTSGPPVQ